MEELSFFDLLPEDAWLIIISFLPRISRQNLATIKIFQDLVKGQLLCAFN